MADLLFKRLNNKVIVESLITELAEKRINSSIPEYYDDCINIVKSAQPYTIVIALLGMKYTTKEICEILDCNSNHIDIARKRLMKVIRDHFKGVEISSSLFPYYLGLLDVDIWIKAVSDV